jgi:hypothetical protein
MYLKIKEIQEYDESNKVNDCIIIYQDKEIHYWANKYERDQLEGAIKKCMASGRTEYRLDLREFGISLTITCTVTQKD